MPKREADLMHDLLIKRIYEEGELEDGYRILFDRQWPRGIIKTKPDLINNSKNSENC